MIEGILVVLLLLVGIWGLLSKRNLIKKVIALSLINSAIVILFLYGGAFSGKSAPILTEGITDIVDPLPQALMLTAIVVSVSITALALTLVYQLYQRYHTLDIAEIEEQIHWDHD